MAVAQQSRYINRRLIGEGGFGAIYIAFDQVREHDVALKVLKHEAFYEVEARRRFEEEVFRTAQLEHRAIVPVYDIGVEEGRLYLAMRLMTGGSLAGRLQQQERLSPAQTNAVLRRICAALDYAHSHGIIHRDLKPDNILFDEEGAAYLADFGIARVMEATATMTQGLGSLLYMAPEQLMGTTQDRRTDVYQMGGVLFQMLTGSPPYTGKTFTDVYEGHMKKRVPSARKLNRSIPSSCDKIIQKALAKKMNKRYQTAGALAEALNAAVGGKQALLPAPAPAPAVPLARPLPPTPPSVPAQASGPPLSIYLTALAAALWAAAFIFMLDIPAEIPLGAAVFALISILASLRATFSWLLRAAAALLKLALILLAIAVVGYMALMFLQKNF